MANKPTEAEIAAALEFLSANDDIRILRRFRVGDAFGKLTGTRIGSLCVIDFETTGVEDNDKAIEIGAIRVEYDMDTGQLGAILDRYSALEDPGFPLPENIVKLTGLTDEDVAGKRFDDETIQGLIESCQLVIAHNAEFDRGFAERRFEFMKDRAWACSIKDIPWAAYDIGSAKLEFIAFKNGYFYSAHRAVADAEVTAGMIGHTFADGTTGLWHLLQKAREQQFRVWALDAPFDLKGMLKDRGYAWKDTPGRSKKSWCVETPDADEEVAFLKERIFKRGGQILVEKIGRNNRFTNRRIQTDIVDI
jgi:DNA polymerase-3 subunit epsilon